MHTERVSCPKLVPDNIALVTRQMRDTGARQRIVDAALRLVAAQGVPAATMRGIALEAGVSTGAVTHHFVDKADVMAAVLRSNTGTVGRRVVNAAQDRRGLDAVEAVMEKLLPLDDEMLQCWTVLISFWGHPAAQEFVATEGSQLGFVGLRDFVTGLLQQAAEDGELAAGVDVQHEAERCLALIGGIGLMLGGFRQERATTRKRARRMVTELIGSLRA